MASTPRSYNIITWIGPVFLFQELRQLPSSSNHLVVLQFCNVIDTSHLFLDALVDGSFTPAGQKDYNSTSSVPLLPPLR